MLDLALQGQDLKPKAIGLNGKIFGFGLGPTKGFGLGLELETKALLREVSVNFLQKTT